MALRVLFKMKHVEGALGVEKGIFDFTETQPSLKQTRQLERPFLGNHCGAGFVKFRLVMDFFFQHQNFLRQWYAVGAGFCLLQRIRLTAAAQFLQRFLTVSREFLRFATQAGDDFRCWLFDFCALGKTLCFHISQGIGDVVFKLSEKAR